MQYQINQLINEVKNGDNFAANILIDKYLQIGKRIIRSLNIKSYKISLEEDDFNFIIYQSVIKSINKYNNEIKCNIEAFIIQRIRRDIWKYFTRELDKLKNHVYYYGENTVDQPDCYCPDDFACNYCFKEKVKNILNSLNLCERNICLLLIKQHSLAEISRILNISYDICRTKVKNIRKKMQVLK